MKHSFHMPNTENSTKEERDMYEYKVEDLIADALTRCWNNGSGYRLHPSEVPTILRQALKLANCSDPTDADIEELLTDIKWAASEMSHEAYEAEAHYSNIRGSTFEEREFWASELPIRGE
tara:strand:+ start:131 stop:490 length:360 start_codon:yes stop_codon:yes gene_type:complete